MDDFDLQLNKLLEQALHGGSPYERATGLKKHISFEATSGVIGSTERGGTAYNDVDMEGLSPAAQEFVGLVKSQNDAPPLKKGGMVGGASTDADGVIRKTFLRLFGKKILTFDSSAANPQTSRENPLIMWVSPERVEGSTIQFDEDGLHVIASYSPNGPIDSITRDLSTSQDRYTVISGQEQASYPAQTTVKSLMGKVTIEVHAKRTDDRLYPIATFYDDSVTY